MENEKKVELEGFLKVLPPVDFACVYGSSLHPNNQDKSTMTDYIIGVSDPEQWHSENLKLNKNHYASSMLHLGGARLVTKVADEVGVGVHFNPFVTWNGKIFKYGVVRMHDLLKDVLYWERFYLSGRLQKPILATVSDFCVVGQIVITCGGEDILARAFLHLCVQIVVDNLGIKNINYVNLRAAISAALLLLPSEFTEEDLYAKVCSLSYMGDLRMLFAEDKNKVMKIVTAQYDLFHSMYRPLLEEYESKKLLRLSSTTNRQIEIFQDCNLSVASSLVSALPPAIRTQLSTKLGQKTKPSETGQIARDFAISSREEAAKCLQRILRRMVMVSSARQAISGLVAVGCVNATRYLTNKISKAWKSWR